MSLYAWYPFEGNTNDMSGNGRNAANNGATLMTGSQGKIGQCYSFDGVNDNIALPNLGLGSCNFTLAAWVKTSGLGTGMSSNGIVAISYGCILCIDSNGNLSLRLDNGSSLPYATYTGINLYDGVWHHVAGSYDGENANLYIDGVLVYSVTRAYSNRYASPAIIGQDPNNNVYFFNGSIDEVRIYNHALSVKEVHELSKAMVLHYDFNDMQEPTTNVVPNASIFSSGWSTYGNGNDGSFLTPFGTEGLNIVNRQSWCGAGKTITLPVAGTYTLSVWIRVISRTQTSIKATLYTSGGGISDTEVVALWDADKIGEWQKVSMTKTYTTTTITLYLICYGGSDAAGYNITAQYTMPQIELKDHCTDFIDGSRVGEVTDRSDYGNNATLDTYSPKWVSDCKIGTGCYDFSGNYQNISVPTLQQKSLTTFTIACWIYMRSVKSFAVIAGSTLGNNLDAGIMSYGNDLVFHDYSTESVDRNYATATGVLNLNEWAHVAATYDNGAITLYKDGVVVATGTKVLAGIMSNAFMINSRYDSGATRGFDGFIDDVRVYATALHNDDIKALYETRYSIDDNGNLYANSFYEETLNRCPDFCDWVMCGNAYVDSEGNLVMPDTTSYAVSPYIYLGANSDWSFRADYYSTQQSNNVSYQPNAGYRLDSFYYDNGLALSNNTAGYNANGAAGNYPINTWSTRTWNYYGGNDIRYMRMQIENTDTNYTQPTGYKARNPMLTSVPYTGKFIPSNGRNKDNTEVLKPEWSDEGVCETIEFSEVGITDGLVAWYPLDGDAKDYSGNGKHGTVTGAVPCGGKIEGGYKFAYTTDNILIGNPAILQYGKALTLSAWVKVDDITLAQNIISRNGPYFLRITSSKLMCGVYTGAWNFTNGTIPLSSNTWYHLVLTYDGAVMFGYVNGVVDINVPTTGDLISWSNLVLGYTTGGADAPFGGIMDDVRIYNRALTLEEVNILYDLGSKTSAVKVGSDGVIYVNRLKECD